jgi:enoyl-CoA hydratase/carnithine racemase
VAAVNGVGAGLGFTFLGYCDFAFLAAGARLRCPFTQLGISPEASSSFLFPLRMGWQNAARALLAGEWFSAEDVVAAGLGTAVCKDDELLDTALAFAIELAKGSLESLQATKQLMLAPYQDAVAQARRRETASLASLRGQPANAAALDAFHAR